MERCITASTKEWRELRPYKTREESREWKEKWSHITVYLDGLRDTPPIYQYLSGTNTILIYANIPDDYDCTEEDKKRKIDEIVADAEKVYKGVNERQIVDLQNAINEYNTASKRIYSILDQMRI